MTISPLVAAFWATTERDQRTRALDADPLWRATVCEIPRKKIQGTSIGLLHIELQEQGTVFCPWCDDAPAGCKCAATPQRLAAYEAHLDALRRRNERQRAEHERYEPLRIVENVNAERRAIG